jgi:hypothetical protein
MATDLMNSRKHCPNRHTAGLPTEITVYSSGIDVNATPTALFFVSAQPVSARKARPPGSKIKWNLINTELYQFAVKAPFEEKSI